MEDESLRAVPPKEMVDAGAMKLVLAFAIVGALAGLVPLAGSAVCLVIAVCAAVTLSDRPDIALERENWRAERARLRNEIARLRSGPAT